MAEEFKLVVNRDELNRLLQSPDGAVARDVAKKAQRVASSARRRAPKRTGELKSSIRFEMGRDALGVYADVGSNVFYARFLENGHRTEQGRVSPRRYLRPALRSLGGRR